MARLPNQGGDNNTWGTILNEYLLTAHNTDGTLKDIGILADKVNSSRTINTHPLTDNITITKGDVGLSNVDNTSDANKPVSTAQQTALNLKANDNSVIHNSVIDTKGDLLVGTANDTIARQAIGTNGQVLTADSSTSSGVAWGGGSGVELGYAEITSNAITTSTSAVDIPGLSILVTVGLRPIKLVFDSRSTRNSVANGGVVVYITDVDNNVLTIADNIAAPAGLRVAMHREVRLTPPQGIYLYKIRWQVISGTAVIEAGFNSPTFLQAMEC